MLFIQLLVNGIQTGALYALTSVGFSLIFGSTRIFHFAHGATFAIGGYIFYSLQTLLQWHWLGAVCATTILVVAFGVAVDLLVYAPIQRLQRAPLTVFVASFGIALFVQNLIGTVFGRGFVSAVSPLSRSVEIQPGLYVAPSAMIAVACATIGFLILHVFLIYSHTGIALRALANNSELVRTFGLDPKRLSMFAFALGSLLVVPAAILTSITSGLYPGIGGRVMLISITATIVGGVGSLRGTACAALLLGLAESLALWWFAPQWSEAIAFFILFVFVIVRPTGFFGRPVAN